MALWDQLKTALRGTAPKQPVPAPSRRQTMSPEATFALKVGFEDMEVIGAFGVFMERLSNSDRAKGDYEGLPFRRERIRTVLLRALSLDPPADHRASLTAALTFLDHFAP